MAKVNVRKKDLLWVYASRFLTLGINILLLPLIMRYLSEDELGLWYVFSSIAQVVNLFDFGFNSTISRHMTYAWSGADRLEKTSVSKEFGSSTNSSLMSEIIITCRLVYLIISSVALVVMATFGTLYIFKVVHNGMTKNMLISWIIYMLSVFLNMFYGYWSSLLQGIGAVAERSKMGVFSKSVQIVIATVLILSGLGLLGFVISYFISGIILRIAGKVYFVKRTRQIEISHKVEKDKIKNCFTAIWGTAWKDGIVMIAQYLSTQANTLICAYYIDLASTSVYGVMTQVVSVIASVATSYFTAYQAAFSSACLRRDQEEQKKIICVTDFVYKLIFTAGMIALFTVGFPLLYLLRPGMRIGIAFSIVLCIFYYFFNQKDLFASMIASSNEVPFWPAYVISAVSSFMLSILFVRVFHMGIMGLVTAQLAVNMAYNCWYWPIYMLKKAGIRYFEIYTIGFGYIKAKLYLLRSK
jgi:O-antigen/teichoic acid export membrane protein